MFFDSIDWARLSTPGIKPPFLSTLTKSKGIETFVLLSILTYSRFVIVSRANVGTAVQTFVHPYVPTTNVFVKCKPGGSTQRSTVLPERAGVDADVKAGALRRPVKLPPGCPGRRYTRHVAIETANPRPACSLPPG